LETVETFGIDWDDILNTDDSTVCVPETECAIEYENLSQSINPNAPSDSYGINFIFENY